MESFPRAVLLDLYGTLAYIPVNEYKSTKRAMASVVGCDGDEFLSVWRSFTTQNVSGELPSAKERVKATLTTMQVSATDEQVSKMTEMEIQLQEQRVRLIPGTTDALSRLRTLPIKLGLVTNAPSTTRRVPTILGIAEYFNDILFSFEVRLVKPDPRIYELASQRLGVDPTTCLFAGDGDAQELEGAHAAGMRAVLVRGSENITLHIGNSSTFDDAVETIADLPMLVERLLKENPLDL